MGQTSHGERRKGEHKDVNDITESTTYDLTPELKTFSKYIVAL